MTVTKLAVVSSIKTICLPAYHSAVVPVKAEDVIGSVFVEVEKSDDDCLSIDNSLVAVDQDDNATILVSNHGKSTYQLKSGAELAMASEVEPEIVDEQRELPLVSDGEVDATHCDLPSHEKCFNGREF